MKKKILIGLSVLAMTATGLTSCGGSNKSGTALAVEKANSMTLAQLEEASRKEWEENPNGKMKVVGLTSVLRSVATSVAAKYDWLNYVYDADSGTSTGNIDVNNGYKDYTLLTALDGAATGYFADYALVQDVRSFSTLMEEGITHNYIPSDAKELGLPDDGKTPLYGVHFNKLFWTNTNFEKVTGKKLYNIWQVAGHDAKGNEAADHPDHLSKVSFQSPTTEQINMSFLVSCLAEENQARIAKAYKDYYGKDWANPAGKNYANAGQQWVEEFIANISKFHTSDGDSMKKTQLESDWDAGVVYYGAFAKMKDAAGKKYDVDLNGNGTVEDSIDYALECGGKSYHYSSEKNVNAMTTVKWDWNINGFNGFMYCMDSQIVNNAQYPYTACLFARTMLLEETYTSAIYNAKNPDAQGNPANQYGYYYPCQESANFRYAKDDWTKAQHVEKEINERYDYLKSVKGATVNRLLALVNSNTKAK